MIKVFLKYFIIVHNIINFTLNFKVIKTIILHLDIIDKYFL